MYSNNVNYKVYTKLYDIEDILERQLSYEIREIIQHKVRDELA